ncbi:MAG: hypothetical protein R2774_06960 [Saprospiraceae bacterium]
MIKNFIVLLSLLMNHLNKQLLFRILKIVVSIILIYILYLQIVEAKGWVVFQNEFSKSNISINYWYISFCILLMPINWLLEATKWKWLFSTINPVTLKSSMITVLVGNTFGVVTPARIGEYGGRIITSNIDHKLGTVLATFIGSLTQNIWNILNGVLFSYLYINSLLDVTYINSQVLFIGIVFQLIVMTGLLYYLPNIIKMIIDSKYFNNVFKANLQTENFSMLETRMINKVLGISLIRFCVYGFQYVLILLAFGATSDTYLSLLAGISIIYMIQTILPVPSLLSVITRGEIALLIWTKFGLTMPQALLSSYSIWLINLIFPAIIGAILMYTFDFKKIGIDLEKSSD